MADRPLAVELHDTYCAAGDWPHDVECVAFEGYEVAANPLLTVLAGRGYARRADVPEVQAPEPTQESIAEALWNIQQRHLAPQGLGWADVNPTTRATMLERAGFVLELLNGGAKCVCLEDETGTEVSALCPEHGSRS